MRNRFFVFGAAHASVGRFGGMQTPTTDQLRGDEAYGLPRRQSWLGLPGRTPER